MYIYSMTKQIYSNAVKEMPVAVTALAYSLLEKEVTRRRQAGFTASFKSVATEAVFAYCNNGLTATDSSKEQI